jgi:hypothetical protein
MAEIEHKEIRDRVRKLRAYKKYKNIVRLIEKEANATTFSDEARALHAGRKVRFLRPKSVGPRQLIDANAREIAVRGRLTEIHVHLLTNLMLLEEALRVTKKRVSVEVVNLSGLRLKTDRDNYVDRFFESGNALRSRLESVLRQVEFYVEDIDQSSYSITRINDALKMVYVPERKL